MGAVPACVLAAQTAGVGRRIPGGASAHRHYFRFLLCQIILPQTGDPNTGSAAATKTVQTLDTHGNLTQSQAFDYGNLSTPARTYNYSYLTGSNYTSRYIYNRLSSVSMTPAGGSAITLVTKSYDNGYPPLQATPAGMHDSNYGTSFLYRGNVTQTTGLSSSDTRYFAYDAAGVLVQTTDALGHTVAVQANSDSHYSKTEVVKRRKAS